MKFILLAVVLAAFSLGGCVHAPELESADPEEVGFSAERLERIRAHFQRYINQGQVTGFVLLIARKGKVVAREVMGTLDAETGRPMREDAIFRIYSMSKPIAAVALMMLHEEGLFRLGDPISKYLPELAGLQVYAGMKNGEPSFEPARHEPTMKEVLSHSAGFAYGLASLKELKSPGDGGLGADPVEAMYARAQLLDPRTALVDMVTKLSKLPLMYQPGTSWSYSVSNDVQGRLVEVISGMSFDRYLDERVFGPLGMKDTGFTLPPADAERFTSNYLISAEGMTLADAPADSLYVAGRGKRFFSGGGGLVSTAPDYLRFAQMLANGGELDGVRILSRKTLALMTMDHLPEGVEMRIAGRAMFPGVGYGLGFGIALEPAIAGETTSVGSFWWGGAANTGFWVDPSEDLIGVVMTQRFPGDQPFAPQLQSLTYQALDD
jgi:CubicO group peptidase (beta-lactamase class C family)